MPRVTGSYESTSVAGETTEFSLSRLEAAVRMVPSLDWLVYSFVRKEAVVSSQIEGTQASLTDLLTDEAEVATGAPPGDVEEICNYLDALSYAREQLRRPKGLPLSVRLLNGAHRRLQIGGTRPGNARFVQPPPHRVPELLGDLERFLHEEAALPPLIRTGLAHVQFETIHPYLDGNGRVGRLLIALCLENWGLLTEPLLYLSHLFKMHRDEYCDRLEAVRTKGDGEGWLMYFLEGVEVVAEEAPLTQVPIPHRCRPWVPKKRSKTRNSCTASRRCSRSMATKAPA